MEGPIHDPLAEENDVVVQIQEVEWECDVVVVVRVSSPYSMVVDLIGGCSQRSAALSHVTLSRFHRPSCQNVTDDCTQMIQNAYLVASLLLPCVPWTTFDLPSRPSRSPRPLHLDPVVGTEPHLLALGHLCHLHDVVHLCTGLK